MITQTFKNETFSVNCMDCVQYNKLLKSLGLDHLIPGDVKSKKIDEDDDFEDWLRK